MRLPAHVKDAIKSGPVPKLRNLEKLPIAKMSDGEKVIAWAELALVVPEGPLVGQPLELDVFQKAFIISVLDNPSGTRQAICSVARRNGKTFLIAVIMLAYIIGPMASLNTSLCSAAMSRDQAALAFELMVKMLDLSPSLEADLDYKYTPSTKSILGLRENVQYRAISSDARTGHGKAYKIILLDEAGQIEAESNAFVEMLESSQSNYDDAIMFIVSTQAPSDAAYLSIQIDHATTSKDQSLVCHLYAADPDCDLMDKKQWRKANPGLGIYRSMKDMKKTAEAAKALPSKANGILNLNFNRRISLAQVFMSPEVWKNNLAPQNDITRRSTPIDIGLDLSQRSDLTAAVACWREENGDINVETHAFAPADGVEQRELRDRAPYRRWAAEGKLILVPGPVIEYEWVAAHLAKVFNGCSVRSIQFDRYRIDLFKEAAMKTDLSAMVSKWVEVGQGYVSMSPRLEALEVEALSGRLRTGGHPLLNLAASQAIAVQDPAGNRKLAKNKSVQKIDPLVAAVMGVFPNSDGEVNRPFSVDALVG